ncbi:MAG: acyltransferase [Planctomycetota bacterium]|nr:MAG: acyltransferase [Planctomycetota bacterium]
MAAKQRDAPDHEEGLPPFSHWLHHWFMLFVRRFIRRHFHALRLLRGGDAGLPDHPDIGQGPVIIYTNHPGWWDPLVFFTTADQLWPERLNYGPIDAAALEKYRFMERIGFVGVEHGTWRGSARFLRVAKAAGKRGDVIFWVTAQGEFADPRQRPVEIRAGVGHAAHTNRGGVIVPMAVEYPFWSERLPEALVGFGPALPMGPQFDAREWTQILAEHLEQTQDRLAAAARRRDPAAFRSLLTGTVGVGGVYDFGRKLRAWARGEQFDASHGGRDGD